MLDIKLIRENPALVKANLAKRGDPANLAMLNELIETDVAWRQNLTRLNDLRHDRKVCTTEIGKLKKAKQDAAEPIEKAKAIDTQITQIQQQVTAEEEKIRSLLLRLPNLLHESVPEGKDDTENVIEKTWGTLPKFDFKIKNHIDLALDLGIVDLERASKVAGARFFFFKGAGVLLDMALIQFALETLHGKGYALIEPPYLMKRAPYEGVTALADFEDVLYKIAEEDLYLIATSEHPMAAMYQNEVITQDELPLRLAGFSPCFRKEAGSHGKDTRGIFRTHQFNKIEQFIFCTPEDSWQLHEELSNNAQELLQQLELPYRMVNVCTGDIGTVAAKKYDFEAWMPAQGAYREVVSCSNCTDYQARRLNIRYREKTGSPPKGFPHTLNSTAIATGRTIVAILENYQQPDGSILVPKVLRKYMCGIEKISLQR
ncbi:MAG: serine--tRNA ligase [Candidatus Bathyarchaeota archaeon]|nr:serine--tRNA ligase [Candidatus Bathyarchaeota archaeon]